MEPVGLGVKVQQPFETLGNVVNMANTVQQMQRGNIALQTEDMVLRERQGVQQFLSNPRNYMNERGEVDSQKLQSSIMSIAPTTGSEYVKQVTEAQKVGTEAKKALNELSEQERGIVGKIANSAVGMSADQARKVFGVHAEQNPRIAPLFKALDYALGGDQKTRDAALMQFGRSVQPVSEQQGAIQGTYLQTGGTAQQISPTALSAGQATESLPITMAPGNLETIEQDAAGNKHIVSRSPQGSILSTRPLGGKPQGVGNSFNMPPGDREAIPQLTAERQRINDAAKSAQTSRFNNAQILQLADETHPGKGAEILQRLGGGYAAIPWTSDSATNFNRLGHFIALEAVNASNAMGIGGTDAGRALAQQATLDTGWTKDAIKSAVKVNDALSAGLLKYNEGMEKAIKNAGGNVLAAREFKNSWTQSFDVNLFRLQNAIERKDQGEIDSILGKKGSAEYRANAKRLAEKSQRLDQLMGQ